MSAQSGAGEEQGGSDALRNSLAAGAGCGCLLSPVALVGVVVVVIIIGGFGVLLAPLIALILLFGGGGHSSSATPEDQASQAVEIFNGDGKGTLDEDTVPKDLADPIEKAGGLCDAIGPIVIASQLEKESSFNTSLVGPDGEKGVSQLPPAIFDKYGKDDDDNGKTSALDAEDSIMAQGRYMCDLAGQAQKAIDDHRADGNALDLALAAYDVGMDSVLAAKGVPATAEAQGYVASIRAQFAKYSGLAAPPSGATPGVTPSPTDTFASTGTPGSE